MTEEIKGFTDSLWRLLAQDDSKSSKLAVGVFKVEIVVFLTLRVTFPLEVSQSDN